MVITSHVWRPLLGIAGRQLREAKASKACGYWNCRRPPAEHQRAVTRWNP